jgi:hypothetical protein
VGRRRGEVVAVREPDREQREHPADDRLAGELGPAAQAQAALHVQLDEVVANPTRPSPVIRNSTSRPEADIGSPVTRWPTRYPTSEAMMITVPPMVGVPRLDRCPAGPSDLISWP